MSAKRLCLSILALALAAALCTCAPAEGTSWTCPNCGQACSSNFCPNCGQARPEADTPDPQDEYLIRWSDFKVELLWSEGYTYSSSDVDVGIRVHVRIQNGTSHRMWLRVEDARINGVVVDSYGQTDIKSGNTIEGTMLFEPSKDYPYSGIEAVCNPRDLTATLSVVDNDNYENYYSQDVQISLSDVPAFTPRPTNSPAPTPRPTPVPSYRALMRGDSGEAVRRLQQQLIFLGYLYDSADGKYGNKTAAAVQAFSEANGLHKSDIATPEMQALLFSGSAKAYTEPYIPLVVLNSSNGHWNTASGNKLKFRFQVTNTSRTRTIKAFEVRVYALDVWGDRIYGDTTYYYNTTTKRVSPGETVYCDYLYLPDGNRIDRIYVCVGRVIFTDGTVHETSQTLDEYGTYWTISR